MHRLNKTFEALAPRRKVYLHPVDKADAAIELIKESIRLGGNRFVDMLKHIRAQQGITTTELSEILDANTDSLWTMTKGMKTTKHYHLIDNEE